MGSKDLALAPRLNFTLLMINFANMKNTLTIIMDTEDQENTIMIGKPEYLQPSTPEEMAEMVVLDIATLCEALVVTIRTVHGMGIRDESESLRLAINHIQEAFVDPELKTEPGTALKS